jgi:hypothetical protein
MSAASKIAGWKRKQPPLGSQEDSDLKKVMRSKSLKDSTTAQYKVPVMYYGQMGGEFPISGDSIQTFIRMCLDLGFNGRTIGTYTSALRSENSIRGCKGLTKEEEDQIARAKQAALRISPPPETEKAVVLSDECIEAIIDMPRIAVLTEEEHQLRGAALLSLALVLRLCETMGIRGGQVAVEQGESGRVVANVTLLDTKTEARGLVSCECEWVPCRKPFCAAHFLKERKECIGSNTPLFPESTAANMCPEPKEAPPNHLWRRDVGGGPYN